MGPAKCQQALPRLACVFRDLGLGCWAGMLGWDVGLGCWAGIDPLVDDRFRTQASCEGELAGKEMHLGFGA